MTDDDLIVIVVSPIDYDHVSEAEPIMANCGHRAWIAPTSKPVVDNPFVRTRTVCERCIDPEWTARKVREQGGLFAFPGARDELSDAIGVAAADQVWTQLGVRERDLEEGDDGSAR